ncbi:hypothetical protein KP509_32G066400 [Ceratopteris richardii]|uniref:PSII 6.1 kDa protein n=1 Tax=Ceratopteris richardii TaxID=49495 RepID=A0A8T2QU94_CERRI|nr:hypothetical protein KP509_32G066400 [Ceratopteris richardii]
MATAASTVAVPSLMSGACVSRSLSSSAAVCARPVAGLPALGKAKVCCSVEKEVRKAEPVAAGVFATSLLAVAQPALALVDDRLSTEGTGLSLGISNPLLIWILLGVATLIWALYFTYTSTLDEDDDSGLAL